MVVLRVPVNDVDLNDEDLGCSWEEQMMKQGDDPVEARKENLEEGDILAMLDRNCITEQFERRVFVLVATEEYVLVFDEKGEPIDEPGSFVEGGWQRLHGDHSFMEEWIGDDDDDGYYKLGVQPEEAPAPAPTTDPAPAPAAAAPADAGTITATIAAIMKPGVRIQECFKESADDPVGKWYGELVVAVTDENCLIAYDDGDMSVHTRAEIRGLVEMAGLKVLEDARGLVADVWQADKACAVSYLRVKGEAASSWCPSGRRYCHAVREAHILVPSLIPRPRGVCDQQLKSDTPLEGRRRRRRRQARRLGHFQIRRQRNLDRACGCRRVGDRDGLWRDEPLSSEAAAPLHHQLRRATGAVRRGIVDGVAAHPY